MSKQYQGKILKKEVDIYLFKLEKIRKSLDEKDYYENDNKRINMIIDDLKDDINTKNFFDIDSTDLDDGEYPKKTAELINLFNSDKLLKNTLKDGSIYEIEEIKLSFTDVDIIPDSILLLEKLKILDLSYAYSIREFPKVINNINTLSRLLITYEQFEKFKKEIKTLKMLI